MNRKQLIVTSVLVLSMIVLAISQRFFNENFERISTSDKVVNEFKEYNIDLSDDESRGILELVRATSVRLKRNLFDKELAQIYKDYHRRLAENIK